jgi:hypothetical protein
MQKFILKISLKSTTGVTLGSTEVADNDESVKIVITEDGILKEIRMQFLQIDSIQVIAEEDRVYVNKGETVTINPNQTEGIFISFDADAGKQIVVIS